MADEHLFADIPCKALIRRGDEYLLVQEMDGQWALPGGRINVGETIEKGLKREVREEIGLEIEIGKPLDCHIYTSKSGVNHFTVVFDAKMVDENADVKVDQVELKDARWVTAEELKTMKLHERYRNFLLSI